MTAHRTPDFLKLAGAVLVSGAVLLLYSCVHTVVNTLGYTADAAQYARYAAGRFICAGAVFLAIVVPALALLLRTRVSEFGDFLRLRPHTGTEKAIAARRRHMGLWSVLSFLLGMTVNAAFCALIAWLPLPQQWLADNSESVEYLAQGSVVLQIVATSLVAPLAEELIFRGVMYQSLRASLRTMLPRWAAALLSAVSVSAVFGWFHGNILQALYCFALSLLMCLLRERTDSLLSPILLHIGFNSDWLLPLYRDVTNWLNGVLFIVLSAALIAAIFWLTAVRRGAGARA